MSDRQCLRCDCEILQGESTVTVEGGKYHWTMGDCITAMRRTILEQGSRIEILRADCVAAKRQLDTATSELALARAMLDELKQKGEAIMQKLAEKGLL